MNGATVTPRKAIKFVGLDEAHKRATLSLTDRLKNYLIEYSGTKRSYTIDYLASELGAPLESVAAQLRRFRKQGVVATKIVAKRRTFYAVHQ